MLSRIDGALQDVCAVDGHDAGLCASFLDTVDPNETFYEPEERRLREEEKLKAREERKALEEREAEKKRGEEERKAKEEREKKEKRSRSRAKSPSKQHICELPRCKTCQPFFVSSVRELNSLSPQTRKMARLRRGLSPKGFYDLTMPSTQYIRSRNQTQDD
ncbi:Calpain-type cysteine protease DEK1 [Frankliniella fusca]|uniref:Calpain-type cysteine protease DEK1 n=1 Tax=Frankliniella fusca TaxID=407009 RepID=A0AAE1LAV7_9NEOP|nr:Calpain-type cysteine protease DEK1 [Frankliniella fusca]